MTTLVSPQLGCLPEPFFPFLRPCWIPGVQRSQQSKAGETFAGVLETFAGVQEYTFLRQERDLLMMPGPQPAACCLAVLGAEQEQV